MPYLTNPYSTAPLTAPSSLSNYYMPYANRMMPTYSGLSPMNSVVQTGIYNQIPTPQLALNPGAVGTGWESGGAGPLTSAARPAPLALNAAVTPLQPPLSAGQVTGTPFLDPGELAAFGSQNASAPAVAPGWFARNFPTLSNLSAPNLGTGWKGIGAFAARNAIPTAVRTGKGIGTGMVFNYGGRAINENLFGDNMSNNSDPTNFGQLYTRGLAGGGKIGGFLGPAGAITGAIGAGIGNALAGTAMAGLGQDSSLGNVPWIGGAFGGGTGTRARDLESDTGQDLSKLTWGGGKERLDKYKLAAPVRAQFVTDFNRDVDILRARGMDIPEAMAKTAQTYFDGTPKKGDTPGTDPLINKYLETSKTAGTQEAEQQGKTSQLVQALTAMLNTNAPDVMSGQPLNLDQFRAIRDQALAHLPDNMRGFAEQADTTIEGRVQQQALDNAAIFRNLPAQIAQAALAADAAKAQEQAMRLEVARISAGKSGAQLPEE
jgi:hypothetical protein